MLFVFTKVCWNMCFNIKEWSQQALRCFLKWHQTGWYKITFRFLFLFAFFIFDFNSSMCGLMDMTPSGKYTIGFFRYTTYMMLYTMDTMNTYDTIQGHTFYLPTHKNIHAFIDISFTINTWDQNAHNLRSQFIGCTGCTQCFGMMYARFTTPLWCDLSQNLFWNILKNLKTLWAFIDNSLMCLWRLFDHLWLLRHSQCFLRCSWWPLWHLGKQTSLAFDKPK